jgi:hypothetical protein
MDSRFWLQDHGLAARTASDATRQRTAKTLARQMCNVVAIDENVPKGKYPKIAKRVGKSPLQYPDEEE